MPFLIPSYTANAYILQQFSLTPGSQTLELVNPYLAISALDVGQRIGFSWLDEVALNNYYSCEKDCVIRCENSGYVRKSDSGVCQCICPPGLGMYTSCYAFYCLH